MYHSNGLDMAQRRSDRTRLEMLGSVIALRKIYYSFLNGTVNGYFMSIVNQNRRHIVIDSNSEE